MKKGFTLIELLVVVLIIGILAAIALPMYTKTVEKSRFSEAMILGKSLVEAKNRYIMENGPCSDGSCYTMENMDIELPFDPNYSAHDVVGYTKLFGVFNAESYGKGVANAVSVIRFGSISQLDDFYTVTFYTQYQDSDNKPFSGKITCTNGSKELCATFGAKACTIDGGDYLCLN